MWHRFTMWRLSLQQDLASAWRMYGQFRKASRRRLTEYHQHLARLDARAAD